MGAIGKPTTLDKIWRWHRPYDVEIPRFRRHKQFIKYHNNKRVHMSLNYMTPRQVYDMRGVTHVVGYYTCVKYISFLYNMEIKIIEQKIFLKCIHDLINTFA